MSKNIINTYKLKNDKIEVDITNFGGTILSLKVKDKFDKIRDVVLGYDDIARYNVEDGYLGATIGRVGNRIKNGKFKIDDKEYQVGINNNGNSLHGGIEGFNKKVWDVIEYKKDLLKLRYFSKDGEEGFPANLDVFVVFSISDCQIKIEYYAKSDNTTIVNLTNHSYFNLGGENSGNILKTKLKINGSRVTPMDEELIPTGDLLDVNNTPFDFTSFKEIGKDIDSDDIIIKNGGGYDINYVVDGEGFREVAQAICEDSGIKMSVYSDNYGVQFYSGNYIKDKKGKNGHIYNKRHGFCLETQNYPDAINHENFPCPILKKGEEYKTTTIYSFEVVK